jgi:hypothetical protein
LLDRDGNCWRLQLERDCNNEIVSQTLVRKW